MNFSQGYMNKSAKDSSNKWGYCIKEAIKAAKRDPNAIIMKGPPGNPEDTAHFWVKKPDGTIYDPASSAVPSSYDYSKGKPINTERLLQEYNYEKESAEFSNEYIIEDILYGLKNYPELRPNDQRINALKSIDNPNKNISRMIDIWESGHGVLSKPRFIKSLKEKLKEQSDQEKTAESAEGIPDKNEYGDIRNLSQDDIVDFLIQLHDADKAGRHYDIRLGDPKENGMLSWAFRKGKPEPGQKHMGSRTQLHSPEYKEFEGEIESGYGKGTVKKHEEGKALITNVNDDGITFSTAHSRHPERFRLQKTDKGWLLFNVTPSKNKGYSKPKIKNVPQDDVEKLFSPENVVMAKIDGSFNINEIGDKVEDLSYRTSKVTGKPIQHTERTGAYKVKPEGVPKNTVLQGELYATEKGKSKALSAAVIGGLLNSSISESHRKQDEEGYEFKRGLFDILRYGGKDVSDKPYEERRKLLKQVVDKLPEQFQVVPGETDPERQKQLYKQILRGEHPVTEEGVVSYPRTHGTPQKTKTFKEWDAVVEDIQEGAGKYKDTGAGALYYRFPEDPEGKIRGKVGTGLSDEKRRDIIQNPEDWKGRRIRIKAHRKEPKTGSLYAPVFIGRHESYN